VRGSRWGGEQSDRPRRGRWSQAEVARLKELYGLRDDESIARELNRPVASVRKMAETIFPVATRTGPWTAGEVQKLKRYLGVAEHEILARILGRSVEEVKAQVRDLGRVRLDGEWTQEEIADLKRLYGTRTDEDIAVIFGRPTSSITRKADELCLAKDKAFVRRRSGSPATRMPRWSSEEIEVLRRYYPDHSNLEIAQKLNRSVKSVVSKAHNIGLKKNRHRLQEMGRQNVSLRYGRRKDEEQYSAADDEESSREAGPSSSRPSPPPRGESEET